MWADRGGSHLIPNYLGTTGDRPARVEQAAQRVTEYLLDKVGDDLRTVTIVGPDDFDVTYLNETLKREYSAESFAAVVDTSRFNQPLFSPDIDGAPVGERRAILHYHEHDFVLQFPFSADETILVSVAREVGPGPPRVHRRLSETGRR